jgi:DNA-binding GntR family transcriptional regulator
MLGDANSEHRLRSHEEHLQIIDALSQRDGDLAEQRMREHLVSSQQRLVAALVL